MDNVGLTVREGVSNGVSPFSESSKRNIGLIMARERGVPNKPTMVTSLQEDRVKFGGNPANFVSAAITRNIYKNAGIFGAVIYGLRIVGDSSVAAQAELETTGSSPASLMVVKAGSLGEEDPGTWGNSLTVKVIPIGDPAGEADKITLQVYYKGVLVETFLSETWAGVITAINTTSLYIMATAGLDVASAAGALATTTLLTLSGGIYEAPLEADFYAATDPTNAGLACFDGFDIQLISCADYTTLTMAQEASEYCQLRGDCIYIGSLPQNSGTTTVEEFANALQSNNTSFIALYNFWVKTSDEEGGFIWVPGVGVVLGAGFIRVPELSRGHVWIPPAGIDSAFTDVTDISPNPLSQELVNLWVKRYSINVAVFRKGFGFYLASSRTMSTNSLYHSIHIRRMTNFLVKTIDDNTQFTVQKPNTPELKRDAIVALTMYFRGIYEQGGLERTIPFEEACIITSDSTNNPPSQDRKLMNIDIEWIPTECTESVKVRLNRNDGQLIVKSLEN